LLLSCGYHKEKISTEWKVRMMKNEKSENPGVVESVSRFVGACVGSLVVGGKEIANEVKEITKLKSGLKTEPKTKTQAGLKPDVEPIPKHESKAKPEPKPKMSTRIAEKSAGSPSEKKSISAAKKTATSKQTKVKK
jgi:hypothetical protein